jgi:hypothetical protein
MQIRLFGRLACLDGPSRLSDGITRQNKEMTAPCRPSVAELPRKFLALRFRPLRDIDEGDDKVSLLRISLSGSGCIS